MSLYEAVFPDPARGARMTVLSRILGIDDDVPIPRLRDAWVESVGDGSLQLAFYARIGDPTYAAFRFALDEEGLLLGLLMLLREHARDGEVDTSQRWENAIAAATEGRGASLVEFVATIFGEDASRIVGI